MLEASRLLFSNVGHSLKSMEEAKALSRHWSQTIVQDMGCYSGLDLQKNQPTQVVPYCKEVGFGGEQSCSGPVIPPGFEFF